jgi:WD40 repeat protein
VLRLREGYTLRPLRTFEIQKPGRAHWFPSTSNLAWAPSGPMLAFADEQHTIQLVDTADGERNPIPNSDTAQISHVRWSPDGKLLATAAEDSTLRVWDVASRGQIASLQVDRKRYRRTVIARPAFSTSHGVPTGKYWPQRSAIKLSGSGRLPKDRSFTNCSTLSVRC